MSIDRPFDDFSDLFTDGGYDENKPPRRLTAKESDFVSPTDRGTLQETWPLDWDRHDAAMHRAARRYDDKVHRLPRGEGIPSPAKHSDF